MKQSIHPQYFPEAKVKCACGNVFTVGSTRPEIQIEICSACHPFYTGKGKLIDVAGRVERFRARKAKAIAAPLKKKSEKRIRKKVK
jgi:large subunit ribosomal protein L31